MQKNTLIHPVIDRASSDPDHIALIMIGEDGVEKQVSALEFHQQALKYAAALQQIGVESEDLVILVLKHSQVLLSAFWGALYLGAIPSIFPFLTEKLDPKLYMERVKTLVAHSETKAVITFPDFKEDLSALLSDVNCIVLSTDDVNAQDQAEDVTYWKGNSAEKIAFLQHSSGTTGLQKGVALSHQAVLNQIDAYSKRIELSKDDVVVSWLPLYHDMGLIAGFVMPIVAGIPLVLMSPFHWIRDPKILLWAIHKHKGTLCWLPNFAYNHLSRTARPSYLEGLDLSSLRALINCSEPVYAKSHEVFFDKFSPYGLKASALTVSYAMAENTFAVTQTPMGKPANIDRINVNQLQKERAAQPTEAEDGALLMVSCGFPIEGTVIRIVGDDGVILPERLVGEIQLKGNCMLTEYYKRPDITSEVISDGWFCTGDMGYLADGQLYVSGRKKDLIIVGGKNIYPQDLESIANQVAGIYPGRAVAFGLFDDRIGSEVIVMVCELTSDEHQLDLKEIESDLRHQIVQRTEVTLADVRLVDRRWLIKTSSGKIARIDNRQKYLNEFRG